MGDYQHCVEVGALAGQLLGYLPDVRNLHQGRGRQASEPD
jgi:hypothetical protein